MAIQSALTRLNFIFFALLCMLCTACTGASPITSLELTGYNHTSRSIGSFSVDIPGGSGSTAGYLGAGEGGGGFTCCVEIPTKWRTGMSITVTQHSLVNGKDEAVKSVVPIPEYQGGTATYLSVHFLKSGVVRVFVTRFGLGHPQYPLRGKDAEMPPKKIL